MKKENRNLQLGKKLLNEAKADMASRKKSTDNNMQQALLEGVSYEVKQPISVVGDPIKAFEFRRKNKIECCICKISSGVFYINNNKKYCSEHKEFMFMDEKERELQYVN